MVQHHKIRGRTCNAVHSTYSTDSTNGITSGFQLNACVDECADLESEAIGVIGQVELCVAPICRPQLFNVFEDSLDDSFIGIFSWL